MRNRRSREKRKGVIVLSKSEEGQDWNKYGVILALAGTLFTSLFSIIQMRQTSDQIEQGFLSIRQTQSQLIEAEKQNKLASDQLKLAQGQFNYSKKQDLLRQYQDSIKDGRDKKQYNENLRLMTSQTEVLTRSFDFTSRSQSPDVIASIQLKTIHNHSPDLISEDSILYYYDIYLENIGGRAATIQSARLTLFHLKSDSFFSPYYGIMDPAYFSLNVDYVQQDMYNDIYFLLNKYMPNKDNVKNFLTRDIPEPKHSVSNNFITKYILLETNIYDAYTKHTLIKHHAFGIRRNLPSTKYTSFDLPEIFRNKLIKYLDSNPRVELY